MLYLKNNSHDTAFNLALEEVLLKSDLTDSIITLYQNANVIVVGRNQNTWEQIDLDAAEKDNVDIIRRISGGGTVYQDIGNLCFGVIQDEKNAHSYEILLQPLINVLAKLGVKASYSGKNDVKIDGKKISGNAQYRYKNRHLHHGTILFNVDLSKMRLYLHPDVEKMKAKGIKSQKAMVTNIKPLLKDQTVTVETLKEMLIEELGEGKCIIKEIPKDLLEKTNALVKSKYRDWNWTYGKSQHFSYEAKKLFLNRGTIKVLLDIDKGRVEKIKFYGDFLGAAGTEKIEKIFNTKNPRYHEQELLSCLDPEDVKKAFGESFKVEEVLGVILQAHRKDKEEKE